MEKELEQAIQTFGMVPEFYQQAFKQAGADFPDELVSAIKADPNKAGELVTSDKNLQQAVLSIFKSNKNAIMKYIQQQSGSMFKEGGKFDYLDKLQKGGKVTRKEMNEKASDRGFSKSDTRKAYRNARNAGLTRQEARNAVIGQPEEVVTEQVVERPVLINSIATPVGRAEAVAQTISARPTTNYDNTDFGVFDFNEAFGRARAAGLSEFTWNGKRYNTKLATITPTESKQEPSPILSKFQEAIAPLVEDQRWINEHRPYWADLKKSGGKIEQENNIRKNYIKDSKEAAKESSEKMKKISKDYDKKLDKVQKEQFGGSITLDSELQRIPKYGHLGLLRKRNPINTSKIDSTFTFIPENKNSYSVPEGTYMRTNYDNEPLYRGFKYNRSDPYQEGTPAIRNFNALRQLWEYAKQNNK